MFKSVVKETVKAPVEKLYDAWSKPEHLSKWFTTNAKLDFKPGGRYSNDDKDEGTFLEIIPSKKISFTWENKEHCPGTEVILDFDEAGPDSSTVTIVHDKLSSEEHFKSMNEGWRWAAYSLKSYLETGKAVSYNDWLKMQNA